MPDFLSTLAEITLTMSAVILLLLALGPLLARQYSPRWRYWAWLAVAVRLLVPVNVSLPQAPVTLEVPSDRLVYSAPSPALPSSPPASDGLSNDSENGDIPPSLSSQEPVSQSLSLSQALFWLWLSGLALVILWHLVAWLRFRTYLSRWAVPAVAPSFLPALLEELGLSAPVRLLSCPSLNSPLMTGLLRPTILLPQEETSQEALWFIFRHELTHFKRRDIFYKTLLLCAGAVHWFNPLVWLMLRTAEADLERACDEDVVRGLSWEDRARYGQLLLDVIRAHR